MFKIFQNLKMDKIIGYSFSDISFYLKSNIYRIKFDSKQKPNRLSIRDKVNENETNSNYQLKYFDLFEFLKKQNSVVIIENTNLPSENQIGNYNYKLTSKKIF